MKRVMRFLREEEGMQMSEEGLLLALIAVVAVLTLGPLGREIGLVFSAVDTDIATAL